MHASFKRVDRLRQLFCLCAVYALVAGQANGDDPKLGELKIIRLLPRNAEEIARAHERAGSSSCEPVPSGEPLEITSFTPILTEWDRATLNRGVELMPSTRRHMLTVGLDVMDSDRARLPNLSGGRILSYLREHFVTIQARVQKDPGTGELFLHHRPLAATSKFGRGHLTEEFTEPTLLAVKDFHSLGIYLPGNQKKVPKNLRTLVMIYKSMTVGSSSATGKTQLKPEYEWVFVRAREATGTPSKQLTLHVFCTSEHRKRLHRLEPWITPRNSRDCGIHASVLFTEYTTLGLIPSKSATRKVTYKSESIFDWNNLDDYGRQQGWPGDSLDNLQQTLDAIIDGKISPNSG